MTLEDMVACRTDAAENSSVVQVPAWKYACVRHAIRHAIAEAGPDGLPIARLCTAVRMRLSKQDLARLGALGWHCSTVRRSMETAGEITVLGEAAGDRLVLAKSA